MNFTPHPNEKATAAETENINRSSSPCRAVKLGWYATLYYLFLFAWWQHRLTPLGLTHQHDINLHRQTDRHTDR